MDVSTSVTDREPEGSARVPRATPWGRTGESVSPRVRAADTELSNKPREAVDYGVFYNAE